jgi:RNA polymerase sigma-70 factor (ECF subfamily)
MPNAALAQVPATPAFDALYSAEFPQVWRTLFRLGIPARDLEDAAHDVFVAVHRRLGDFDPARPVRPWVLGFAYKVAAQWRRRAHHRREVFDSTESATAPDARPAADEALSSRQDRTLVQRALDALEPDRRIVFVMHELEGCAVPEIALAVEVPLNTAYSRLRLARRDFADAVNALRAGERP